MARYNDQSSDCTRWTNAKLMRETRKYANLETFGAPYYDGEAVTFNPGWTNQDHTATTTVDDFCREQTRIYRQSWLEPLLDEIERRFVKGTKA